MTEHVVHFSADGASAAVDVGAGCRLSSLVVAGKELLVTGNDNPMYWGSYPMAPWPGRTRHGEFSFAGKQYVLPANLANHAGHGTVFDRPWQEEGDGWFRCDLGPRWPFPGYVRQHVVLDDGALRLRLEVHSSDGPMPAECGWHPWFRRDITTAGPVHLDFDPGFMLRLDDERIPTGERVPPPPGPWDDCFGDLARPPVLTWPGALQLTITSACDYWVVYSEPEHAVCVEPQTAAPNGLNGDPFVAEPGKPRVAEATLTWRDAP